MGRLKILIKYLFPADLVVIIFLQIMTLINLFNYYKIPEWQLNISINFIITFFVIYVSSRDAKKSGGVLWSQLHLWYLVPFVFLIFKELLTMIGPVRGLICDEYLIGIDRFIFGTDPTKELYRISNTYLTELLQIVYGTFFFLPVILGIDFKLSRKSDALDYSAFIIVYGFTLSFIGYILIPAIGPRFTLHDFATNNLEMPGILITDFLREIVNSAEGIPAGTLNPSAVVQRDCFPSGHTQMTLLVMYLSVRFRSRVKWFFIINGTLLIFATVYLRYHYVADLIGGALFMLITLLSGKYLYEWLGRKIPHAR